MLKKQILKVIIFRIIYFKAMVNIRGCDMCSLNLQTKLLISGRNIMPKASKSMESSEECIMQRWLMA